ncbi:hypothetical protein VM98_03110 [Streptomyces rubellomurinus subsp. indigoferus]|nr:hypothetical protein VM98_03110 [Streptomyces rubellomurinus subsp. indigoferus]
MTDLTVQILCELAPQDLAAMLPAVVQLGDQAGVVLRLVDAATGLVELYQAGRVTVVAAAALDAEFVTAQGVQTELLQEALRVVHDDARQKLTEDRESHATTLADIRQYAIARHEDGSICREGLDRFLEEFGFEPYVTRVRVDYTISGSYEVEGHDATFAEEDAQGYLQPELSSLDDVVDESSTYDVTIVDVTEL